MMKSNTVYVFVGRMKDAESERVFRSYVAVNVPCNAVGDPEDGTENPAWHRALAHFLEYADMDIYLLEMKLWRMASIVDLEEASTS